MQHNEQGLDKYALYFRMNKPTTEEILEDVQNYIRGENGFPFKLPHSKAKIAYLAMCYPDCRWITNYKPLSVTRRIGCEVVDHLFSVIMDNAQAMELLKHIQSQEVSSTKAFSIVTENDKQSRVLCKVELFDYVKAKEYLQKSRELETQPQTYRPR